MAITYENVVFDRVIESLNTLLADEFSIPIRYDEHKGNQSFLITPGEDELIEHHSTGQSRTYSVAIQYQLVSGGEYTKNNVKQVSEIAERVKRLIHNNTALQHTLHQVHINGMMEGLRLSPIQEEMVYSVRIWSLLVQLQR